MASGSSAFPAKAGYNQSGGGYYIVITSLDPAQLNVLTAGTGSGGATTVGTLAAGTTTTVPGGTSTLFAAGRIVKDMGKTIVSAGRTFRKIQAVLGTDNNSSPTFGVTGNPALTYSTGDAGYATYYVETGRDGANAQGNAASGAPAALARYF
jgi:hypothetical protein